MYLHLGTDTIIRTKDILGIFDLDTSTISKRTRDTLRRGRTRGTGHQCIVRSAQELCRDEWKKTDHLYFPDLRFNPEKEIGIY